MRAVKVTGVVLVVAGTIGLGMTIVGMSSAYRRAAAGQILASELADGISTSLTTSFVGGPLILAGAVLLVGIDQHVVAR